MKRIFALFALLIFFTGCAEPPKAPEKMLPIVRETLADRIAAYDATEVRLLDTEGYEHRIQDVVEQLAVQTARDMLDADAMLQLRNDRKPFGWLVFTALIAGFSAIYMWLNRR